MRSARININPEVLTFAREKVGYSIDEIAKKISVKSAQWEDWEQGEAKPTTIQLLKLADQLERSPAFFYLDKPPEEENISSEFRTLKNVPIVGYDPNLIKIILEAKRNRLNIIELYEQQKKEIQELPEIELLDTDVLMKGLAIRKWLGITIEDQFNFSSSSQALSAWRGLVENQDIYVVQFPRIEIAEARGFALAETEIPIIGINSRDSYTARIFTLIHELIHIFLRDSVLINDELNKYYSNSNATIEQFCNRLAAEVLVPTDVLLNSYNINNNAIDEIRRLATKFRVSPFMLSIRALETKLIDQAQFEKVKSEVNNFSKKERSSSGGNPYRNRIVQKGRLLISNAFQAYFDGEINLTDLSQLTQWKIPNLNRLAAETFGWSDDINYL